MMNVLVGLGGLRREVQAEAEVEVEGENSVRHGVVHDMRCGVMVEGLLSAAADLPELRVVRGN
jgi:hypothetical protein